MVNRSLDFRAKCLDFGARKIFGQNVLISQLSGKAVGSSSKNWGFRTKCSKIPSWHYCSIVVFLTFWHVALMHPNRTLTDMVGGDQVVGK
mmetsp:Transcript_16367/g.19117  ORF Transcript_16367/g.19117 Transcript_16367/m.19117 type:complete len:90 (-) Transcript_16367:192-461(-)